MEIYADSFPNFDAAAMLPIIAVVRKNILRRLPSKAIPTVKVIRNIYKDFPVYVRTPKGDNIIALRTNGNDSLQWIYQLSHEYMHHCIEVHTGGTPCASHWFEESLCCLSTMLRLYEFGEAYPQKVFPSETLPSVSPAQVLEQHKRESRRLLPDFHFQIFGARYYHPYLPMKRDMDRSFYPYYNALAVRMMPLFLQKPNLWNVLPFLRFPSSDNDSEHYFQYLEYITFKKREIMLFLDLSDLRKLLFPHSF